MKSTAAKWERCFDNGQPDIFSKIRAFQAPLQKEYGDGNRFFGLQMYSSPGPRVMAESPVTGEVREFVMMGSNSYLGLSCHPRVVEASVAAAKKYGYGTGAVSLFAGTTNLHVELERRIAAFYRCEAAILYPTGYAANVGTLSGVLRKESKVVSDMFSHASIYDGCSLSGAQAHYYLHNNMKHLNKVMRNSGAGEDTLIVTDGVFSMEGDVAKLDEIVEIAQRYGSYVMIDEAHATGVVGPGGRGTAALKGVEGKVDITMGTLSKAPGSIGGYAAGSQELIDYLRFYARSYFFSTSLPAPVVAGLIEVFDILENDEEPHRRLWENIIYMRDNLKSLGFDTGNTDSAIIPVIVPDEAKLKALLRDLFAEGIFINFVSFPAVPKNKPRLRMSIMSGHSKDDLDQVLGALERFGRKHEII